MKEYGQKINEVTLLFIFDPIYRGKMVQILLVYSLSKETVTTLMMLYKNTKGMVFSLDSHIDFFKIVTGFL